MTLQQEAINLITDLSDDNIQFIIEVIHRITFAKAVSEKPSEGWRISGKRREKMEAFAELERMRKSIVFPKDFDPERELQEVLDVIDQESFEDFEDCLQDKCAKKVNADYIVTVNKKDFATSEVPAFSRLNWFPSYM